MGQRIWAAIVSSAVVGCAFGLPGEGVPAADDAGHTSGEPRTRQNLPPPDAAADAAVAPDAGDATDAAPADAAADAASGSAWETPTCDGTVAAGEYGGTANQYVTTTGQTWHVAWDGSDLYVAIEGANVNEALVLYVGYLAVGASGGQVYDQTAAATIAFAANAVVYAKASYDEVRTPSNDVWTKTGTVTVCVDSSGTTREVAIPWSSLGAPALPAAFRWMGYLTSASGYVYGQLPDSNPSAFVGLSATFPHDFFVKSTADGTGSFPFDDLE
jgi:hypothetical protein